MNSGNSSPWLASTGERGGHSSTKAAAIAPKNSSPTIFSTTGKRPLSTFTKPAIMLLRCTANRRVGMAAPGAPIPTGIGCLLSSRALAKADSNSASMTLLRRGSARGFGQNAFCRHRLRAQHRPIWNVIVPFDDRGDRSDASDDACIKLPHRLRHGRRVSIDQQRRASVVDVPIVPAEMDFLHPFEWKLVQIVLRTGAEISGRDEHVVDVEQQPASGPPRHFGKEFNFRDGAFDYTDVSGRIFE